ncbi:serine/threonine-protein kinase [Parapedobacter defluvii]|uniref:serine/threonine protein kinase n=1 Tax=Parapedobacter defluvii TaxID=2045106 RepID=UPI003340043E
MMIGKTIQGYRVDALLGEGGMGKVYLATDLALDRKVAIKNLNANLVYDATFLERFTNEARILSRLSHPNIALLYNYVQQGSDHYMVMEYVEGDNMDAYVHRHGALSPQLLVPILVALLEGLGYAHQKGVLHRDIKPANLMLTPDGSVKIMDFGIARISDQANRLTKVKSVIGTLDYLAPELIQGGEPSPASDCYALGVVAYELATGGILPFKGTSEFALMQAIIKGKPLPSDKLNKAVPRKLASIIGKAMEADSTARFGDTNQFRHALLNAFPHDWTINLHRVKPAPVPTTVMPAVSRIPPANLAHTKVPEPTKISTPLAVQPMDNPHWRQRYRYGVYAAGAAAAMLAVIALVFLLWPSGQQTAGEQDQVSSVHVPGEGVRSLGQSASGEDAMGSDPIAEAHVQQDVQQLLAATGGQPSVSSAESESPAEESRSPRQPSGSKPENEPAPVIKTVEEPATIEKEPEEIPETRLPSNPESETNPGSDRTPATMVLDGPIAVNLRLRGKLEETHLEKGKVLSFSVTKPVTYRGYTIIPTGALATAEIRRVGSKQVSIRFNNVSSVSGRTIPFAKSELSGKRSDMLASPDFVVMLEKGVTVP